MSCAPSDRAAPPAAPAEHTVVFEPEFIAALRQLSDELVPFNKLLGLTLTEVGAHGASAHLRMQPQLVGHFLTNRIHGGAIASVMDAVAGLAVMGAIGAKYINESVERRLQRFSKLGTIDMRVDFLRPGIGEAFQVHAQVLRLGSRVASTRMEFVAMDGTLLSTGTAAYIVS